MSILLRSITLAALALVSGMAAGHDGGTNAEGCHHDGKGYHCHRGGASRPSPVQPLASDRSGSSPDEASGGSAHRNCTTATLSCGSIEEAVRGTGSMSAMGKTGEERGMKVLLEAGGPGLLVVLAALFVLGLCTIRGVQGRSQRRTDGDPWFSGNRKCSRTPWSAVHRSEVNLTSFSGSFTGCDKWP